MNNIKILILEDNTIVGFDIKRSVEALGYEVTKCVTTYNEALNAQEQNPADIAIMDIDLGKYSKDGIETAKDIQKIKFTPIIFLTAFSDNETMQKAINGDFIATYITKPYNRESIAPAILVAKSRLRNTDLLNNNLITLKNNYIFDKNKELLYYQNEPIKLSKQERKLFSLLIAAKGNIVDFENIEYEIWPDGPVSDSSLRTLLYRIRNKVNSEIIETVQSFGCRINIK
ncbi:DNA-binding response regulator [Malaciobacter molluscorum LMG 25693]|uniref:DNA-binding response regulator n=1 Tax=Malaciobacter molluscorum LMG 25693 TaxID=870501 RepID=A0A2G1DK52_9BACT|nr:response regulator [Malaciobacter molluscorum]AXX92955.1 two-component system response regulator [Malaciobacter molluscorum LMG 25693]PHO18784.1 DNA-binding response regulator [Malaciobacter molluscorum LMG 25693]RXJ96262.1 DNA-binding response regulator [Malaciobacter molluscorum]